MRLAADDARLSWPGAVSIERGDGWVRPWRIPFEQRLLFGKLDGMDKLLSHACQPAGVRCAFVTDSITVGWDIEARAPDPASAQNARLDVCCNGTLHQSVPLLDIDRVTDLPPGEKVVELWLPHYCELRVHAIDLHEGASVRPYGDPRPRLLVYGSSNTQSRGAESPVFTWPAVLARSCRLNLTNLGYGSACHLDPMVARMMRDLPADLIVLELGINIYINAALNSASLRAAFVGFVELLREGHPDSPIVAMSSVYAAERETTPNLVGLTLASIREELSAAVEDLRALGNGNLYYIDGLELFGSDLVYLQPDRLHPNGEGYKRLGERVAERVREGIFPASRVVGSGTAGQESAATTSSTVMRSMPDR